eukprot:CCRYP_001507-RE/>CCRYP_001507-RE protein AED:0.24 eAED:0.20 QI:0/-1/0/1/-1/1/1/0/265
MAPLLNQNGKKFIQQVCSKFLFLGRAVDPTLLCHISAIASQSSKPTVDTLQHTKQLLDYIATQHDAVLTYNASDMVLAIHSDASYLSKLGACSRAGGHFFLSSNTEIPPNNRAVLNIAHVIKHVMASATEAELAALYIMAREAVFIRVILEELGHKKPATPLQTDNSTAEGVVNSKSNPNAQKPWTCDSIGSSIMNARNNSASTGAPASSITPTTGPNIILPPIIKTSGVNSSHHNSLWQCCDSATAPTPQCPLPNSNMSPLARV